MFIGKPKEAETSFTKAVYYDPKFAIGYRTLAWLKLSGGEIEEALNWARKSLELSPTDLETLILLSLIHMDSRKYTLALATLQRATELGPDYGRAYYNLGNVYMKLGVPDLALENFLLAIKHRGDPNCFIDAGYVYLLQKDYDIAKEMFKQSIREGHIKFAAHYYLGLAERLSGNENEAVEQFKLVIETAEEPENSQVQNDHFRVFQASAFASIGKVEAAKKLLDSLSEQNEKSGEMLSFVARGYSLIGDADNCRKCLHRAFQLHDGPTEKEAKLDPHFQKILD
jgi:tetratricopeptide (TPR) repeat protein